MDLMSDEGTRRLARSAFWMVIIAAVLFGLVYFSSLLQPFIIALFIWYIIRELNILLGLLKIRKHSLPVWLRTTFSFIIIIAVVISISFILADNVQQITEKLPVYKQSQDNIIDQIAKNPYIIEYTPTLIEKLKSTDFQPIITGALNSFTSILGDIFLIIIYIIFLLIEENIFSNKLSKAYKTEKQHNNLVRILTQLNKAVNKYLLMKTAVSLLAGFLSYWMLVILDVDFPILWAFLIFLFNYIPYIGAIVSTLFPAAFAIIQFNSLMMFVWVFISLESIHLLIGNFVEPRWMGKSLNQSPLIVVVALTFWGSIWGVLGMFISVPITSVMIIILAQFESTRKIAILLTETGEIDSIAGREDNHN